MQPKSLLFKIITKKYCEWEYTYTVLKLRLKQVISESNIKWQHKKAKATRYSARYLKNVCILPENSVEDLRSRRECCWSYIVSVFENMPKNLVVQGKVQLEHISHIVKVHVEATSLVETTKLAGPLWTIPQEPWYPCKGSSYPNQLQGKANPCKF